MKKSLIVFHGNDLEYLNILLNVIKDYQKTGIRPTVLYLSDIVTREDSFNRFILKLNKIVSPEVFIFQHLRSSGVEVLDSSNYSRNSRFDFPDSRIKMEIYRAIRSALISKTGCTEPPARLKNLRLKSYFETQALRTLQTLNDLFIDKGSFQFISVINGRFPYQRAVELFSEMNHVRCNSYERGTYENSFIRGSSTLQKYYLAQNYWHESFRASNRLKKQEKILELRQEEKLIIEPKISENWVNNRIAAVNLTHIYNEGWKSYGEDSSSRKQNMVVFFTSSLDEHAELGEEWKEGQWLDQWSAFHHVIKEVERCGIHAILRVHPNLRNKPRSERLSVKNQLNKLRKSFPKLEIIDQDSSISSYNLIRESTAVVVWSSTIGLESVIMGVPTACLNSCEYDLVVNVQRWHTESDVDIPHLLRQKVDANDANIYFAGVNYFDRPQIKYLEELVPNLPLYGKGLALFANRWAFRGNNRITNLISLILPLRFYLSIRRRVRRLPFYRS